MKARQWFRFSNNASDATVAEIHIVDIIGDWIDEIINDFWGIKATLTAKAFLEQLSKLDASVKTIRVHINSPGGDVFAALNIANALRDQQQTKGRTVETIIDGLAASAASVIAMAGSVVRMSDNALMMVHNPWSVAVGNAGEMRKAADTLDTVRDTLVATYQWHSTLDADAIKALLDAETWMDASQALEHGFATDVLVGLQAAATIDRGTIKALTVPEQFRARVDAFLVPPPPGPAAALDVVRVCNAAGCPELVEDLLANSSTLEQVNARVATAKSAKAAAATRETEIRALCARAKFPQLAAGYIRGGMSADAVREHLTTVQAAAGDSTTIDGGLRPDAGVTKKADLNAQEIYAARNQPSAK